jgi:hypothetical protein
MGPVSQDWDRSARNGTGGRRVVPQVCRLGQNWRCQATTGKPDSDSARNEEEVAPMEELVIGVPARDEGATIAQLSDALELGSAWLGEATRCELVLAYQPGADDTLGRWQSRRSGIPNRVLQCAEGLTGKGRNVKLLIRHAQETSAHLLLVDADLGAFPPSNVGLFVRAARLERGGLVLPVWCRPKGQGNSTDFLACPLLLATFGAQVRQPLAGQMLLTRRLLATLDVDRLPDGYGIDVALTMHALDQGLPVTQVVAPFPEHQAGANSHRIMADVAGTLLGRLAAGPVTFRADVRWPDRYWEQLAPVPPSSRSLEGLIDELAVVAGQPGGWQHLLQSPPEEIRDLWCSQLAAAVRGARAGEPISELLAGLTHPFLVHAEYRRRSQVDVAGAESYVADLGYRLADALS